MSAEAEDKFHRLPAKPSIQAEEIDAACVVARKQGWYTVDQPRAELIDDGILCPITMMQMEEALKAAFDFRHGLYNAKLRYEASALVDAMDAAQLELDGIRAARSRVYSDQTLARNVRELLRLIGDHPALKIAQLYHDTQTMLDNNPDWNPEWNEQDRDDDDDE